MFVLQPHYIRVIWRRRSEGFFPPSEINPCSRMITKRQDSEGKGEKSDKWKNETGLLFTFKWRQCLKQCPEFVPT